MKEKLVFTKVIDLTADDTDLLAARVKQLICLLYNQVAPGQTISFGVVYGKGDRWIQHKDTVRVATKKLPSSFINRNFFEKELIKIYKKTLPIFREAVELCEDGGFVTATIEIE